MAAPSSIYSFQVFDSLGNKLADLNGRASGRQIIKSRNQPDEITWSMDLAELEAWCHESNVDVSSLLANAQNIVKVKRGNDYISGGQMLYWNARVDSSGASVSPRAIGWLGLLKDRYTSQEFSAMDGIAIVKNLIDTTQSQPYGDFGITLGDTFDTLTVGLYNKSYVRDEILRAIQDLTESPTRGFDMEMNAHGQLDVYAQLGTDRNEIRFEYPGNILEFNVSNDATDIANQIYGIGSGNGPETQALYPQESIPSKVTHKLRERFLDRRSTDNEDGTLTDAVDAELISAAFPFEIPAITVDGSLEPSVTDYSVGDRVHIRIRNHDLLSHINGMYRIERMTINIDENDTEKVTLEVAT
jgi:hypothetical protein